MVKNILKHSLVYLLASIIILLDQYTKHLVRTNLAINEAWNPLPWLAPYARILHIQNTGAAFGMMQNLGPVFMVIALIVSTAIIFYALRIPEDQWWMRIALGLQLGGAVGNLIDRIIFNQAVTDFISVGSFAIFNIADASISTGVALLLILMLLESRQEKKDVTAPLPPADAEAS